MRGGRGKRIGSGPAHWRAPALARRARACLSGVGIQVRRCYVAARSGMRAVLFRRARRFEYVRRWAWGWVRRAARLSAGRAWDCTGSARGSCRAGRFGWCRRPVRYIAAALACAWPASSIPWHIRFTPRKARPDHCPHGPLDGVRSVMLPRFAGALCATDHGDRTAPQGTGPGRSRTDAPFGHTQLHPRCTATIITGGVVRGARHSSRADVVRVVHHAEVSYRQGPAAKPMPVAKPHARHSVACAIIHMCRGISWHALIIA